MKKWLYFSTLIMAVLISIIISNSNLTLASQLLPTLKGSGLAKGSVTR